MAEAWLGKATPGLGESRPDTHALNSYPALEAAAPKTRMRFISFNNLLNTDPWLHRQTVNSCIGINTGILTNPRINTCSSRRYGEVNRPPSSLAK